MLRRSPGLLLLLCGVPFSARAAEPPPRLTAQLIYTPGPGLRCPEESVLRAEVKRHLGYDPFSTEAKRRIVATVRRDGHQVIGQVEAFDEAGAPEWSKPPASYPESACPALLAGMGNAIAFHLDPLVFPSKTAALPVSPKADVPEAKVPGPPGPEPPDKPKPKEPAPPKPFEIGVGPQLAIGAAGPAFSVLGHVGFRWSLFSAGIDLRYDAPSSAQAEGAKVQAYSVGGALAPCVHVSYFLGCVLLAGGAISVSDRGVDQPRGEIHPYFGMGPRVGFEKHFTPWLGVRLQGEALVMLQTFQGTVDGVPMLAPSPLSSRVNGATGAGLFAYF